jgi:chemotaxis-related protein WspD
MRNLPSDRPSNLVSRIDDCWNKIGVHGDASCLELKQHAHCRNCPTFTAAAISLLEREPPSGYIADWTRHFAQRKQDKEHGTLSAVVFRLEGEWFALPTLAFDEVAEQRPIHSLPHRRNGIVLGLVNVRGELLICVSLGKMLGMRGMKGTAPPNPLREGAQLLIMRNERGRMAFPVDEVQSIHRYHPRELRSVPATVLKAAAAYTTALLPWGDKLVGMLDDQLILRAFNGSVA